MLQCGLACFELSDGLHGRGAGADREINLGLLLRQWSSVSTETRACVFLGGYF